MGNYSGSESSFPDYSLCDAYCEGRKASVGGVAIGAAAANNPLGLFGLQQEAA